MSPFFIFLILFGSLSYAEDDLSKDTTSLQLLHIIVRHGARNPVYVYPKDPNKNYQYKEELGELTNTGKLQQYTLGKYFRKRYANFITSNPKEVVARSSDMDRTIMSGLSHLAGLYGPTKEWQFTEELHWQPIKILTSPLKTDKLLYVGAECPEASTEYKRIKNSPEGTAYRKQYADLFSYVSKHSGAMVDDWLSALFLFDAIKSEKSNNMSVPDWVTDQVYEKLQKINEDFFYFAYKTVKMQRLRAGPLIGDIVKHLQEKDRGKLNNLIKVYAYFTHDANIAALLNALNIFNGRAPSLCATVLMELHKFDHSSCVKVFYSNSTNPASGEQHVHLMTLPDCGLECCPLDTFVDITHDLIPVDWEKECELETKIHSCIA